jgi:hypothetical protein
VYPRKSKRSVRASFTEVFTSLRARAEITESHE